MQKKRVLSLLVTVLSICLLVIGAYALSTNLPIPSSGQVSSLQAFWDAGLTNKTTTIDWGSAIAPDSVITRSLYLKNLGGQSVNLSMTVTNWNPFDAPDYLSVSWDRQDYNLTAGGAIQCTLTLTVYANVTESTMGAFSFVPVFTSTW